MRKIPTLFIHDPISYRSTPKVEKDCEWVLVGEGFPTIKWDGTACLWYKDRLWKRRIRKKEEPMPEGWIHWTFGPHNSGHGWVPVDDRPENYYYKEALYRAFPALDYGTYELVGPKFNGNPENLKDHTLMKHSSSICYFKSRDFKNIRDELATFPHEGIVWHHPDGRMAKIKRRDFGFPWPVKKNDARYK